MSVRHYFIQPDGSLRDMWGCAPPPYRVTWFERVIVFLIERGSR